MSRGLRGGLAATLMSGAALCAAVPAHAQLIPGFYAFTADQSKDQSGLVISSATAAQIPTTQWGDQGYTVNAWGNCNCEGNPALDNNDTLRITGYNAGTGPAQVNGISVFMVGGAANKPDVGATTGLHVIEVANGDGPMWGLDVEQADSPFLGGYGGTNSRYLDNELDMNIGSSQTTATYLSLGGMILQQPSYAAGITLNYAGSGKLGQFLYSYDGMADVGLHLGRFSKQMHANDGSQSIQMDWTDTVGNLNSLTLAAFENTMVLGTTNGAAPASYAVQGAAGIYANLQVSASCSITVSGGLITGHQGC